jgi:hypothetical protein
MKRFPLSLLTATAGLFFVFQAYAGVKPPKKFGDVSKQELEVQVCPIDSSASAYYIFDWGEAYFDFDSGEMLLKYHARIKIINDQGFSYGDLTIPFSAKKPVTHLKAATYNLVDGKVQVSKVNNSMIFNEKVMDEQRQLKISFPDVREGSVIEYTYLKSAGNVYRLVPWTFQADIPVMYSEFNLRIPDNLQYKFIQEGYQAVNESTKKSFVDRGSVQSTEYHWVMKEIPALKEEPYMPDVNNFYARLEFELASIVIPGKDYQEIAKTWEGFEKELKKSENFMLVINKWKFLEDSVRQLTADDDLQTIRNLHDFIGRHVKWDGSTGLFTSSSPRSVYKEGSGSSAEINLMLTGLLRQAGFEAWPVILSTRSNGMIRNHFVPIVSDYNYVAAWARKDGKEYLLDATEPLLDATLLPPRCLNGEGRVISDKPHWVKLIPPSGYNESHIYNLKLSEEGLLDASLMISRKGYNAYQLRKMIEENGMDKVLENKKKENSEWEISSWKIGPEKDPSKPLVEKVTCTIDGKVEDMGDIFILNPLINPEWKENPFRKEKRTYPVDFVAPHSKRVILSYQIPEGYTIEEMPHSVRLTTPDKMIVYTYAAKAQGNRIQVLSSLTIRKALFTQDEYQALRSFFAEVLAKQAEQIVIKKKS